MEQVSHKGLGARKHIISYVRAAICAATLVALLAAVGLWAFRHFRVIENFHPVTANEVYRSALLSPVALDRRIRELGLRSVINLRGERDESWFKDQRTVIDARRVDLYSIFLGSGTQPPPFALRQLAYLLDTARRPLLLHCGHGIERSGLASAVAVLLAGGDLVEARKQFGLIHGFVPWFQDPPKLLDDYEQWISTRRWSHTPDRFRQWVQNDYVPYFYRARLEPLDVPTSIAKGKEVFLHFRATNMSPQTWRSRSEHEQGVRLGAKVRLIGASIEHEIELRGGFHNLTIAPGESVVLQLPFPPLKTPGRYQIFLDLVDEDLANHKMIWFSTMGSEPVGFELNVVASEK